MSKQQILVDVEKAIKEKSKKEKPSWLLVQILKKIAHQDDLNSFLINHPEEEGLEFLEKALTYLNVTLEVEGMNQVPKDKRHIFVSNHPLGGMDGMAMGYFLGRHFDGKVKFMANDLLMHLTPLHSVFIPVNKHGGQVKKIAEIFDETFKSEDQILIYPAGLVSRLQKGTIRDLEWKKTFVTKAKQYERDIVPIYFRARNSWFFYILANIRKTLKIKANIEMLFLVDEMYKQKNKTFKAYIGKPISWKSLDKSKSDKNWAAYIKDIVYQLKKDSRAR